MPSVEQSKDIIQRTLKFSSAPETEVHVGGGRFSLTRFANNEIHQNVEERNLEISVRVVLEDKRTARATTNRQDDAGLKKVVEQAIAAAKISKPSKALPMLEGGKEQISRHVDEKTEAFGAMDRAKAVVDIIAACKKAGLTAAGQLTTKRGSIGNYGDMGTYAIGNSKGLFRFHDETSTDFSLTVMDENSSGWSSSFGSRISDLDLAALTERAIEKCKASRNPEPVKPGGWTVILEPAAVASLVWFLSGGFAGRSYHSGNSWSSGFLGKSVTGPKFELLSDPYDPRNIGRPFDGEGLKTQRLSLIEKGILKSLTYSRLTASKQGTKATGHGPRLPSSWAGGPSSLIVGGGKKSVEEMIKSTERGILVTRFWYNRLVEPRRVVVTGMTRDGTFLVEKGKVTKGIRNLRYNQSVLEAFKNIVELSAPIRSEGMIVPAMKLNNFNFSSVTKF
ncbi:MAG: metallopeptidase TldD-related protein [Planctomycetota bacterium]|nr:metallopeptidase TldD-related protein [Planctomycetota bacterium]